MSKEGRARKTEGVSEREKGRQMSREGRARKQGRVSERDVSAPVVCDACPQIGTRDMLLSHVGHLIASSGRFVLWLSLFLGSSTMSYGEH